MRLADHGCQLMLCERSLDPRHQVAAIRLVIGVLKLAPAALRKVTAWRHLMVRARDERSVWGNRVAGHAERDVLARGGNAVASSSYPDDLFKHRGA